MTLKLVFTAFLLDAQDYRECVKIKTVSLLVVPLGKALSELPPSWCGRQMAAWQLLSELVISLSRDRRISMQQNIENNKNRLATD